MTELSVPVRIVGGGGAGLTASMLLSQLGVETLLVSALPTTSVLPKAHVLNQRTMEILTDVGAADAVYAHGTPAEQMRPTAYYAGLAGPDPIYGRAIAKLESWGAGGLDADWASASGVTAEVLDKDAGESYRVRSRRHATPSTSPAPTA